MEKRLYVPVKGGELLRITWNDPQYVRGIETVPNGNNDDAVWVEHPYNAPFNHSEATVEGLECFEHLCVETQACVRPEMRWLVAMQAGLFPYIRAFFPARFITALRGPSQEGGKTTGAQRFTLLHGLGEVDGDVSVAALNNSGDCGLLVLYNKEQANFEQPLIDHCLFLATGAKRRRSTQDGRIRTAHGRPVGLITTIEGVPKRELQARTITIDYRISGVAVDRGPIEREIRAKRHVITSALMDVLWVYLAICGTEPTPNPQPNFAENFRANCDLLRAYGMVTGKPTGWAEKIIAVWNGTIGRREVEENDLEQPLCRVLQESGNNPVSDISSVSENYRGSKGKLYVVKNCTILLSELQKLNIRGLGLPKNAQGLSRRLDDGQFLSFTVLTAERLKEENAPDVPEALKRRNSNRPVGFFFQDGDEP